jgi:SAM-dependent methyltransferase
MNKDEHSQSISEPVPNDYSSPWFTLFDESIPDERTAEEVAFLTRYLPRSRYTRLADLCCGTGRHANVLANQGYDVVGIDRSPIALEKAREVSDTGVTYHKQDMRGFTAVPGTFDAVVCLWQSFGYFDPATNRDILRQINAKLTLEGRFVLDIYNQEFFEDRLETREFVKEGVTVTEQKTIVDDRLTVRLSYDDQETVDVFEWQLYTPGGIREVARDAGFRCLLSCTGYDEDQSPTSATPRMQFVFEKHGAYSAMLHSLDAVGEQFAGDYYDRNLDWADDLPDLSVESEEITE